MAQPITRKLVIKHRLESKEVTEVSKYEHTFQVSYRETKLSMESYISVGVPKRPSLPKGPSELRSFDYEIRRCLIQTSGAVRKMKVERGQLTSGFYRNLWFGVPVTYVYGYQSPPDPYVELQVHIQITGVFSTKGEERTPTRDFSESDQITDAVLLVEEKKFHVSKAALGWNSWYFRTLFTGGFDESNKNKIELKEVSANCVQHILECICGLPNIDENVIHELLQMADLWQIPSAIEACQKFLMEEENITDEEKLELAVTYRLTKLEELCKARDKTTNLDLENLQI